MQLLYNSDQYVVVRLDVPADGATPARGGYEIVDKFARKDIYIEGAVADSFRQNVDALVETGPDAAAVDAFLAGYTRLAQQTLALH